MSNTTKSPSQKKPDVKKPSIKKDSSKKNEKKDIPAKKIVIYSVKIVLVLFIAFLFLYQEEESFSNSLPLLAVTENDEGEIVGGSVIDLNLKITKGTGQTFVNANSLKEIDTQLSITNGQDTACSILELNCENYDFYYTFKGNSVILKGPSATASIALLTAKTINNEKITQPIPITGSLNSAGVIGPVGGINKKVEVAEEEGYKKVLIPLLANQNVTSSSVDVIPVLDFIEAYNAFGGKQVSLDTATLETKSYNTLMSSLSEDMCSITSTLKENVNISSFDGNRTQILINRALDQENSSKIALDNNNYYSAASFCFGANNNLETLNQIKKNKTLSTLLNNSRTLNEEITNKKEELTSNRYLNTNIKTKNDFYVYLLLHDRIDEAKEFLEPYTQNSTNVSSINKAELEQSYAYAKQRFVTISLWEDFIVHQGENIYFTPELIDNACSSITTEIISKSRVLEQYEISSFEPLIKEQENLSQENPYLCLYNGLELSGRIDTVFFSYNIAQNSTESTTQKLFNLTQTTIANHGEDNFPIIPYIYYQYSKELYNQGDFTSSLLYTNYALSFSNLDFYLQEPQTTGEILQEAKNNLFTNPLFLFALLVLLGAL